MKILKILLLIISIYLISFGIGFMLSPVGGAVHKFFWGPGSCSLFVMVPCDSNRIIEGFIYMSILFLSFFSFLLLEKKVALLSFFIGTLVFWILSIYSILDSLKFERSESIGTFIIMLISFALGYGISFLIKRLKLKKKKTD